MTLVKLTQDKRNDWEYKGKQTLKRCSRMKSGLSTESYYYYYYYFENDTYHTQSVKKQSTTTTSTKNTPNNFITNYG